MKRNVTSSFHNFAVLLGFITLQGCKDTIFKTNSEKIVQKEANGDVNGGTQSSENNQGTGDLTTEADLNRKGDGLKTAEDLNQFGTKNGKTSGKSDQEKNPQGKSAAGTDSEGNEFDSSPNNRRTRPALSTLSALGSPGGDTPLALDWNRDRMFRTSHASSDKMVQFDVQGKGTKQIVEWLAPEDAWLGLDLNHNGVIDDGTELFGNGTRLDGALPLDLRANNGFEALAQHDKNRDGKIDRKDEVFFRLLLWTDRNSNGQSEENEIKQLQYTSITYLSVLGFKNLTPKKLPKSNAFIGWTAKYGIITHGIEETYELVDIVFPTMQNFAQK